MCGIVGHIGPHHSVDIVLEGLKRLEYRGYDSAGVSFVDEQNQFKVFKKEGKIANLIEHLGSVRRNARSCIGHTRWATHGEVNDANSHPHTHNLISIVHNGIIENAEKLRSRLSTEGFEFRSQTDSEVFLGLVIVELKRGASFIESVSNAFKQVEGNSAFVVLNGETQEILAVKKGAPLVCGIHEADSQALVSSDPYALAGLVDKLYFPEDNVLCSLSGANQNLITFYELDGTKNSKRYQARKQEMGVETTDKGEFEHFMLKEIYEQPGLIQALPQFYFSGDGSELLKKATKQKPTRIHIVACGTAYYAGQVIRQIIELENKIPCELELASEFRYKEPLLRSGDLGLFISQSGETADTLAAQSLCKQNKIPTMAIVNVVGSTLYRECDNNLLIRAGMEVGVASTKAFTQMVLTGKLLSLGWQGALDGDSGKKAAVEKFELLSSRIEQLLKQNAHIQDVAQKIYKNKGFFFTGRGRYYPIALEGALKLKEIAYVHAEGYAAGELKHGPLALIDEKMVNIALIGPELFDKTLSNIQEIKARRGIILTLGQAGNPDLKKISDYQIPLEFSDLGDLSCLYINVANQLLAYYMAKYKGTDIDKPRNLAKSVTVE